EILYVYIGKPSEEKV
ncbi:solute symporter family protein, partial [Chlamydia psittaci C1/97]